MKINLEILIGAVQEMDECTEVYYKSARSIDWYDRTEEERVRMERACHYSGMKLFDLCALIGVDQNKVYKLGRSARKYEKRNNWEKCFPANENYDKIMAFIA